MREAVFWIEGQWTLFDFDTWLSCSHHLHDMCAYLNRRLVDGQPPVVVEPHLVDVD